DQKEISAPGSIKAPSVAVLTERAAIPEIRSPALRYDDRIELKEQRKRRRPAVHQDRRGARRNSIAAARAGSQPSSYPAVRQAEAKLCLAVDPVRRNVRLSIVLLRPEGFPERIEVDLGHRETAHAFDDTRYDDIDVAWTTDFLAGELRL